MEFTAHSEEIDFQKYWLVLKRRWLPATATFAFFLALGFLAALKEKTEYEAQSQILIETDKSSELTGIRSKIGEIDSVGNDPLSTEAQILSSRPILEEAINSLGLQKEDGTPFDSTFIKNGLKVEPIGGTDILDISYTGRNREQAAPIVNAVVAAYMKNNLRVNRSQAVAARAFIEEQIPQVETAVRKAEEELRNFKEVNRVADLAAESSKLLQNIGDLERGIAETEARFADANAQYTSLRGQVGMNLDDAVTASSLSQSAGVQQALTQLQEVQVQLASERTRFTDANPQLLNLREREAALNTLLQERIGTTLGTQSYAPSLRKLQIGNLEQGMITRLATLEVERSGVSSQLETLKDTYIAYKKRLNILPKLEQRQRELERRLNAAQSTYETLLVKLQEAHVTENQNVGNVRVIATAIEPDKEIPNKAKLIILAGGLFGIVSGAALAFLLDILDKSLKSVQEAREVFGYTMLGIIPTFDQEGKIVSTVHDSDLNVPRVVLRDMSQSPVRESYQMLQANLRYLSSDEKIKSVVVASSVPGEGKSEVSANLAAAMAQVGHRVLLIDADMRQPMQHHIWGLTNAIGLSNILIGEAEWHEAAKEVMPGLDVLASGVIPPNPVALLDSQRMARLVSTFSQNYDYVIFDTPPLNGIADTTIVGKMVDGILLVVRPQVVDSASANAAKELITRTGQNVLGLVANGIAIKSEPDGYFFYKQEKYRKQSHAALERVGKV